MQSGIVPILSKFVLLAVFQTQRHFFHCIYAKSYILLQFLYKTGPARVPLQVVMGPRNPRKSHLDSSVTSLSIQIAFKAAQMVPNGAKLSPQNPQNASKTMENG